MLILTRKTGESLVIGEDVFITVLGVKGHQVRFGIDAPKDIPVHRQEIYFRIQDEKMAIPASADKVSRILLNSKATH